jgi:hypothetical protein
MAGPLAIGGHLGRHPPAQHLSAQLTGMVGPVGVALPYPSPGHRKALQAR